MKYSASTAGAAPAIMERDIGVTSRAWILEDEQRVTAPRARLSRDPAEACVRVLIGGLFLALAWRLGSDFVQTGRLTDLLLLVGESLVVVLTSLRRYATAVDRRAIVRAVTAASLASPFLIRPGPPGGLISESASAGVAAIGLLMIIAGKLSLGYSFGFLPAHRGLVQGGLYRFVRHPIYVGYLLTHGPFLLSHPTIWNAVVIAVGDAALIARACYEEQTLARDPAYGRYCQRVRWRLVPGVY
jgi:protein-S-isoprenylcysteine O-methyltransferase Ste14